MTNKILITEILKSIGLEIQISSWDRETFERLTVHYHPWPDECAQFEYVVGEQDVWQFLVGTTKMEIVHAYKTQGRFGILWLDRKEEGFEPYMAFERVFFGTIKTKEEFLKLPEQVGCPFTASSQSNKMEELTFDKETADGLYRIFCGLTRSCYEHAQVYDLAKPSMKRAYEKVLDWGIKNCDDMHGEYLRTTAPPQSADSPLSTSLTSSEPE